MHLTYQELLGVVERQTERIKTLQVKLWETRIELATLLEKSSPNRNVVSRVLAVFKRSKE